MSVDMKYSNTTTTTTMECDPLARLFETPDSVSIDRFMTIIAKAIGEAGGMLSETIDSVLCRSTTLGIPDSQLFVAFLLCVNIESCALALRTYNTKANETKTNRFLVHLRESSINMIKTLQLPDEPCLHSRVDTTTTTTTTVSTGYVVTSPIEFACTMRIHYMYMT